jgi:hypothetical protein
MILNGLYCSSYPRRVVHGSGLRPGPRTRDSVRKRHLQAAMGIRDAIDQPVFGKPMAPSHIWEGFKMESRQDLFAAQFYACSMLATICRLGCLPAFCPMLVMVSTLVP